MGRRESAVVVVTEHSAALARFLREQRQRRGVTYAAMASTTQFNASMFSKAASGRTVPSWNIVKAFITACHGDLKRAESLWKMARWAEQRGRVTARIDRWLIIHPELIEDYAQLRRAMIELRAKGGQPSLAELERRAGRKPDGKGHRLPKSSLGAILRREALPQRGHVSAFVEAMGARKIVEWERAWDRAAGRAGPSPAPVQPAPEPEKPGPTSRVHIRIKLDRKPTVDLKDMGAVGSARAAGRMANQGLRGQDVEFLVKHGLQVIGDWPPVWPGPRPPNRPAGHTHAGLPIRVPRRYDPLGLPPAAAVRARPRVHGGEAQGPWVQASWHSVARVGPIRGFLVDEE